MPSSPLSHFRARVEDSLDGDLGQDSDILTRAYHLHVDRLDSPTLRNFASLVGHRITADGGNAATNGSRRSTAKKDQPPRGDRNSSRSDPPATQTSSATAPSVSSERGNRRLDARVPKASLYASSQPKSASILELDPSLFSSKLESVTSYVSKQGARGNRGRTPESDRSGGGGDRSRGRVDRFGRDVDGGRDDLRRDDSGARRHTQDRNRHGLTGRDREHDDVSRREYSHGGRSDPRDRDRGRLDPDRDRGRINPETKRTADERSTRGRYSTDRDTGRERERDWRKRGSSRDKDDTLSSPRRLERDTRAKYDGDPRGKTSDSPKRSSLASSRTFGSNEDKSASGGRSTRDGPKLDASPTSSRGQKEFSKSQHAAPQEAAHAQLNGRHVPKSGDDDGPPRSLPKRTSQPDTSSVNQAAHQPVSDRARPTPVLSSAHTRRDATKLSRNEAKATSKPTSFNDATSSYRDAVKIMIKDDWPITAHDVDTLSTEDLLAIDTPTLIDKDSNRVTTKLQAAQEGVRVAQTALSQIDEIADLVALLLRHGLDRDVDSKNVDTVLKYGLAQEVERDPPQ
eukprot:m.13907 g.13907  ORF g.13907 m.13907 type:complete len:570 (-) comp8256_c0_seq1:49-1758(-)